MEIEKLLSSLFNEEERIRYLNLPKQKPITTFRINNLKGSKKEILSLLKKEGFEFEEFKPIVDSYILIQSPFPLGKSLSYYLGNIYIQDLSSMLPPIILNPEKEDLVLDMCSAPGSKTTQIADLMKNSGLIIANDVSKSRSRFLAFNILRIGVLNSVVTNIYGNRLGRLYFEKFDKILIDAPCSALGIIRDHPEVLKWWKFKHSKRYSNTQFELLVSGIKALKQGGRIVYSTCTIVPEENEEVIKKVLIKYPVKLEFIDFKGFKIHRGIGLIDAVRIYPHENIGEGFFIASLRKIDKIKQPSDELKVKMHKLNLYHYEDKEVREYTKYLIDTYGIDKSLFEKYLFEKAKELRIISEFAKKLEYFSYTHRGIPLLKIESKKYSITTWGALFLGKFATENVYQIDSYEMVKDYFSKKELPAKDKRPGYKIVKYRNFPIGYGVSNGKILKPRPKLKNEIAFSFN